MRKMGEKRIIMAKRINASTITKKAANALSEYNHATLELRILSAEFKEDMSALNEERDTILENREKALEEGVSIDKVTVDFSTVDVDKRIRARSEKYKADCEPHRNAQREARKLVPKDIYESYKTAYVKGNISAYEQDVKNFLLGLGISVPTAQQLTKTARQFVVRTSGARRASAKKAEEGHYISEKSSVAYKDVFMLAILEWLVTEKKVLKVLPDNTLVKVNYEQ